MTFSRLGFTEDILVKMPAFLAEFWAATRQSTPEVLWLQMKRYQTQETLDGWAVLDLRTGEVLGGTDNGSKPIAKALTDLLNALDIKPARQAEAA